MSTAVNVTTSDAQIVAPGHSDFIHIYNNSDTIIYLAYDGAASAVATGMPLPVGSYLQLNNDGHKEIFMKGVRAIHNGIGNKEVRIQGV